VSDACFRTETRGDIAPKRDAAMVISSERTTRKIMLAFQILGVVFVALFLAALVPQRAS
jgi:hypothetical protein